MASRVIKTELPSERIGDAIVRQVYGQPADSDAESVGWRQAGTRSPISFSTRRRISSRIGRTASRL
jgi:hypothetical protein